MWSILKAWKSQRVETTEQWKILKSKRYRGVDAYKK